MIDKEVYNSFIIAGDFNFHVVVWNEVGFVIVSSGQDLDDMNDKNLKLLFVDLLKDNFISQFSVRFWKNG